MFSKTANQVADFIRTYNHDASRDLDLESMAFLDPHIFQNYVDLLDAFSKDRQNAKKHIRKIEKQIMDDFGLLVQLTVPNGSANAYVMIPAIDRDHPLYRFRTDTNLADFGDTVKKSIKEKGKFDVPRLEGEIDIKNAKVSGFYSEIKFKITVTTWFFAQPIEEMASVLLHEVGHAYSTCLYLGRYYSTNYVMAQAMRVLNETDDAIYRQEVILATAKTLKLAQKEYDEIAKVKNKKVQEQLLLGQVARDVISDTGGFVYDRRGAEHWADYFVSRLGGAVPLAKALERLNKEFGSDTLKKNAVWYQVSEIVTFFAFLFTGVGLIFATFILLNGPLGARWTYGTDRERMTAMFNQVAEQIKGLIKEDRDREDLQELVDQYEQIVKVRDEFHNAVGATDVLVKLLTFRQMRISEQQRQLEKMNANSFFIEGASI